MLNFDAFDVLTFDCYGTLIDWETGLWDSLVPVFQAHHVTMAPERALELYGEFEAAAEADAYRDYKTVLRTALDGIGARLGFTPTPVERDTFSRSVQDWPAFPDSPGALQALKTKYQLGIISNIDDDLFAFSNQRLQVQFDWIVTAQQVQSYKPSVANFRAAFARMGVPPHKMLHVAQSLFHDIVPARSLGLATVWVNRRRNKPGFGATPPAHATPDVEVPDLRGLATTIGLL
jgi:2-haloacid dehalogenase